MRDHAPAYYDDGSQVWALTRYDDVLAAEKDPLTFSSERAPRPHGMHLPMMISMDDPEHLRRRKLVSRGFTPRRVRDHEATIRRICTEIIDRVAPKKECDFVWDIAAPLPLLLIADMLGFPEEAYDDLTGLAQLVCQTSVALISLIDADRQWFKSERGLGLSSHYYQAILSAAVAWRCFK